MSDEIDNNPEDYIDFLHQRIMHLEEELKDSEQTVLDLKQEMNQSDVAYDPIGVIPISDYLDWVEREKDYSQEKIDRLREKFKKLPVTHLGPGRTDVSQFRRQQREQKESMDDVTRKVEDMKRMFDRHKENMSDALDDGEEGRSGFEESLDSMEERRKSFREKMGLDDKDEE